MDSTQATIAQLALMLLAAVGFVAILVGLIALLSIMRRVRIMRNELQQDRRPHHLPRHAQHRVNMYNGARATSPNEYRDGHYRPSAKQGSEADDDEQVVLEIAPDEGPTRAEVNVRRIIAYLKQQEEEAQAG
ncbi:MAG: hypothetical protein D6712_07285 [Chloroflexi bacterium]|nr:MAG: hypothetical protein D6712_07285 [Chloroflexota bacterium]